MIFLRKKWMILLKKEIGRSFIAQETFFWLWYVDLCVLFFLLLHIMIIFYVSVYSISSVRGLMHLLLMLVFIISWFICAIQLVVMNHDSLSLLSFIWYPMFVVYNCYASEFVDSTNSDLRFFFISIQFLLFNNLE